MPDIASSPVTSLRGVGPRMAEKLAAAGIERVEDLLFHLPLRYQDRTRITPLGAVQPGVDVVVEGEIRVTDVAFGRRRSLVCRIQDSTGMLSLRFYHFSGAQQRNLEPGRRLRCFGEVRRGASGLEMYHPEYRVIDESQPTPVEEALTPVYPTTAGISQTTWRKLCSQAVELVARAAPPDLLPEQEGFGLSLVQALDYLHAPPPDAPQEQIRDSRHPAQLRLALEELVAHNLSLEKLRRQQQSRGAAGLGEGEPAMREFAAALPFELTAAQQRVIEEICRSRRRPAPAAASARAGPGPGRSPR